MNYINRWKSGISALGFVSFVSVLDGRDGKGMIGMMLTIRTRALAITWVGILAGCGARAENEDRYRAIDSAIRQVMCSASAHDRSVGVLMLADAVEAYQGRDKEDTGTQAVEVSMDSFKEQGCQQKSGPSGVKG